MSEVYVSQVGTVLFFSFLVKSEKYLGCSSPFNSSNWEKSIVFLSNLGGVAVWYLSIFIPNSLKLSDNFSADVSPCLPAE